MIKSYYIFALTVLIPTIRIFRRAGFHAGWAAFLCAPIFGPVLAATLLAFRPWKENADV